MPPREPGSALGWALGGAALIAVLVVLAALLDLGPFADDELSRTEFVARADAVCTEAHDAFVELQAAPPRTAREARDLTEQLAGIARDEREEIDGLDGPAELDPLVERYLAARDEGIAALEAGSEAADAGDPSAYAERQEELASGQPERRRIAREIGLSECSRPLGGRR